MSLDVIFTLMYTVCIIKCYVKFASPVSQRRGRFADTDILAVHPAKKEDPTAQVGGLQGGVVAKI